MCPNLHPYSKVKRIQDLDAEGNEADVVRIATQQGQRSQDGFSLFFFLAMVYGKTSRCKVLPVAQSGHGSIPPHFTPNETRYG